MKRSRFFRGAALALTVGLLATACGSFAGGGEAPSGDANSKLTIALQFAPKSNFALETDDAFVLTQVGCLETLLRYNAESGELEPMLATEWKQTEPTAWDFTLREGVKFQDGSDLTAEAVVASLDYLLKADAPPRAFTPAVVAGVEAVDATTVRVSTETPSALVPFRLASVNTGILAPKAYSDAGIDPIKNCTGPFVPVSQQPKQSISLERNETYWGTKAALAQVEARFIVEGATRATQVQTGESHVALAIPAANAPELEQNSELSVSRAFTPRTTGLYFNTSKPPFDSPIVRKALQAALDLDAIAASVYDGGAKPAIGPFSPDEPWAPTGMTPVKKDTAAAKQLLTDAGIAEGQLNLTLLAYNERPEFADLAAVIQANLAEIGITVKIKASEYAAIEADLLAGDYDLSLLSRNHLTDIADPIGFLTADYSCEGGFNISQFCDKAIDAKLTQANGEAEASARHAIYAEVAKQLQEEAVTVFIVSEQTTAARRTEVQNFIDDPLARYAVTPELALTS